MQYAKPEDIKNCRILVEDELAERGLVVSEEQLKNIVEDVMNITYSKGGDYSKECLKEFCEMYFEVELYSKHIQ